MPKTLILCSNQAEVERYTVGILGPDTMVVDHLEQALNALREEEIGLIVMPDRLHGGSWDRSGLQRFKAFLTPNELVTSCNLPFELLPTKWIITTDSKDYKPNLMTKMGFDVQVEMTPNEITPAFVQRITEFKEGPRKLLNIK